MKNIVHLIAAAMQVVPPPQHFVGEIPTKESYSEWSNKVWRMAATMSRVLDEKGVHYN